VIKLYDCALAPANEGFQWSKLPPGMQDAAGQG
jgi:hypothetical protein